MAWLSKATPIEEFMEDICTLSLYGFGSIDSLLNLKIYELYVLKQMMRNENVKETFKKIKFHNFD